jgi:hypothetical protein
VSADRLFSMLHGGRKMAKKKAAKKKTATKKAGKKKK